MQFPPPFPAKFRPACWRRPAGPHVEEPQNWRPKTQAEIPRGPPLHAPATCWWGGGVGSAVLTL